MNQKLERVQSDDPAFDEVNELVVVVPASEGDFVESIQAEIAAHSVLRVARVIHQESLALSGISMNPFVTVVLFQALAQCGAGTIDMTTGALTLQPDATVYMQQRAAIEAALTQVHGLSADNARAMFAYLEAYYQGYGKVKRKGEQPKPSIRVHTGNYQKFKELWQNLNRDAVLRYELDADALTNKVLARMATDFEVRPMSISVTRTESVERLHSAKSTQSSYEMLSQSVYTLSEFVRELANLTKLSYHTVASILGRMPAAKFAQIRHNENRALTALRDLMLGCVYELLVNKVTYEVREVRVKTSLTDKKGNLLDAIQVSLCGTEAHAITNAEVQARSLFTDAFMPVDSQIERRTVDESNQTQITVFAKLPKINIPTPAGNYNPDFGYAIAQSGTAQALYLVVETKGYDNRGDLPTQEKWKIDSAKQFFKALQALPELLEKGVQIHFQTKINGDTLAQLISSLQPPPVALPT